MQLKAVKAFHYLIIYWLASSEPFCLKSVGMAINRSICLVFMVTKHVEQSRAAISTLMRLSTAQLGCRRQAVLAVDVDQLAVTAKRMRVRTTSSWPNSGPKRQRRLSCYVVCHRQAAR